MKTSSTLMGIGVATAAVLSVVCMLIYKRKLKKPNLLSNPEFKYIEDELEQNQSAIRQKMTEKQQPLEQAKNSFYNILNKIYRISFYGTNSVVYSIVNDPNLAVEEKARALCELDIYAAVSQNVDTKIGVLISNNDYLEAPLSTISKSLKKSLDERKRHIYRYGNTAMVILKENKYDPKTTSVEAYEHLAEAVKIHAFDRYEQKLNMQEKLQQYEEKAITSDELVSYIQEHSKAIFHK